MSTSQHYLTAIINIISKKADPDKDFFYLGGPMTGIPQFNFPEFNRVAEILRNNGYNIVSPAELDDPETEAAALASADGAPGSGSTNGESHADFLRRDVIIVSLPHCAGGIFMEGWEASRGARAETWALDFYGRDIFQYTDEGTGLSPQLTKIDRNVALRKAGVTEGLTPEDPPGALTAMSNAGAVTHSVLSRSERETEEQQLGRLMWGGAI